MPDVSKTKAARRPGSMSRRNFFKGSGATAALSGVHLPGASLVKSAVTLFVKAGEVAKFLPTIRAYELIGTAGACIQEVSVAFQNGFAGVTPEYSMLPQDFQVASSLYHYGTHRPKLVTLDAIARHLFPHYDPRVNLNNIEISGNTPDDFFPPLDPNEHVRWLSKINNPESSLGMYLRQLGHSEITPELTRVFDEYRDRVREIYEAACDEHKRGAFKLDIFSRIFGSDLTPETFDIHFTHKISSILYNPRWIGEKLMSRDDPFSRFIRESLPECERTQNWTVIVQSPEVSLRANVNDAYMSIKQMHSSYEGRCDDLEAYQRYSSELVEATSKARDYGIEIPREVYEVIENNYWIYRSTRSCLVHLLLPPKNRRQKHRWSKIVQTEFSTPLDGEPKHNLVATTHRKNPWHLAFK